MRYYWRTSVSPPPDAYDLEETEELGPDFTSKPCLLHWLDLFEETSVSRNPQYRAVAALMFFQCEDGTLPTDGISFYLDSDRDLDWFYGILRGTTDEDVPPILKSRLLELQTRVLKKAENSSVKLAEYGFFTDEAHRVRLEHNVLNNPEAQRLSLRVIKGMRKLMDHSLTDS